MIILILLNATIRAMKNNMINHGDLIIMRCWKTSVNARSCYILSRTVPSGSNKHSLVDVIE